LVDRALMEALDDANEQNNASAAKEQRDPESTLQ
jgi:hypothetical protein